MKNPGVFWILTKFTSLPQPLVIIGSSLESAIAPDAVSNVDPCLSSQILLDVVYLRKKSWLAS